MSKKKPKPPPRPARPIPGLVDAHTHLASCGADTPGAVREFADRAAAAGVGRICTVGDGLEEAEAALSAAHADSRVFAACAIHPTRAGELDEAARARLAEMARDPRCVAVGETGIDTYWIRHEPKATAPIEVQQEALRWHAGLAADTGRALMIHNREGDEQLLEVLDGCTLPEHVILHCFSSPVEFARRAVERGWVLSFAGNVTFKRNDELRAAAALTPPGQLLIETDAPYMTPEPHRGTRNEPAFVGHTALCVAEARGVPVAELAAEVSETFERVYGL